MRNKAEENRELVRKCIAEARERRQAAMECYYKSYNSTMFMYRYGSLMSVQTDFHRSMEYSIHDDEGNNYKNVYADSDILLNPKSMLAETEKGIKAHSKIPEYPDEASIDIDCRRNNFDGKLLVFRINELVDAVKEKYPLIKFKSIKGTYLDGVNVYGNLSGVTKTEIYDKYMLSAMFCASDGTDASNLKSYTVTMKAPDTPLLETGAFDEIINNTNQAIIAYSGNIDSFDTLIIMPDALEKILKLLMRAYLSDKAILSKKSVWSDKLLQSVTDSRITLSAVYDKNRIVSAGRHISDTGIVNRDACIIDHGKLINFCLSREAEKEIGSEHTNCDYGFFSMEGGEKSYKEMIEQTESGLIISRIQARELDFWGNLTLVIKNAVVVENGVEKGTLGTGYLKLNLEKMLNNIAWISKEIAYSGNSSLPRIAIKKGGFTVC